MYAPVVSSWLARILFLWACSSVHAFNFTWSNVAECGQFDLQWSGGQPPFSLFIDPQFMPQLIYNINDSAFSDGHGQYSMQLSLPQNQTMVMTMSDADGFATGGVSEIIEVGASTGDICNTTHASDFLFDLPLSLQQCRTFTFQGYVESGAVLPVTITALIPGGTPFVLNVPADAKTFNWIPNVEAGTSIIFSMTDAKGRKGGSSDFLTVSDGPSDSCLSSNSPSSTIQLPAASRTADTSAPSSSGSSSSVPPNSASRASDMKIAIGVAISVVGGIALSVGTYLIWRRRQQRRLQPLKYLKRGPVELGNNPNASAATLSQYRMFEPEPFLSIMPSAPPAARKTAGRGMTEARTVTFVQHTDADEIRPDANGVVELPPIYPQV